MLVSLGLWEVYVYVYIHNGNCSQADLSVLR